MGMMIILALLAAVAAPGTGKTMAMDDWQEMAIYGAGGGGGEPLYLQVHAGDLDGDGVADDAVLRLACSNGQLTGSSYVIGPRDAASGMPTGKRQHAPVTIVKEWNAASPELSQIRPTYDVKTLKGARMATTPDGWTPISLSRTDALCSAGEAAARTTPVTRSNISNN
jgi:hypothetical protein